MTDQTMSATSRRRYVGSSEVASLFGLGRISRYELWHRKAGTIEEPDISEQPRVRWGTRLEATIAEGAAEQEGWAIEKAEFVEHPLIRGMACHPDYDIAARDPASEWTPGTGILEVKNVDALVYRDWDAEVPPHIELQLQHQFACTGRAWGAFAILVGGNDLRVVRREASDDAMRRIEEAILEFWESIEAKQEPAPDYSVDLRTLTKVYGSAAPGKVIDLRANLEANELAVRYIEARNQALAIDKEKDALKAQLLPILGDCERALLLEGISISRKEVTPKPVSYTPGPRRDFRISQNKTLKTT